MSPTPITGPASVALNNGISFPVPDRYALTYRDDLALHRVLTHDCGVEVCVWNSSHENQNAFGLAEVIRARIRGHEEKECKMPAPRHDFTPGSSSTVCECGAGMGDIVHTDKPFTDAERLKLRDRIGADLIECSECHEMVDAESTVRVMKLHDGRHVRGRLCSLCKIPPAKRNPFSTLAVRLARGSITQDEYEDELERLTRAQ